MTTNDAAYELGKLDNGDTLSASDRNGSVRTVTREDSWDNVRFLITWDGIRQFAGAGRYLWTLQEAAEHCRLWL